MLDLPLMVVTVKILGETLIRSGAMALLFSQFICAIFYTSIFSCFQANGANVRFVRIFLI